MCGWGIIHHIGKDVLNKVKDLLHQRFGSWFVISMDGRGKQRRVLWLCRCDCGKTKIILGANLTAGRTKSCGCKTKLYISKSKIKHGHKKRGKASKEYISWRLMISRCCNPNNKDYAYYGGRGIGICERWRFNFNYFFMDMGLRPSGLTLERIDNDGNYEPGNCRWASRKDQVNNRHKRGYLNAD